MRFDDSAPRRLEDRKQLAAMLRSAAAEVDATAPGNLDLANTSRSPFTIGSELG